MPKSNRPSVLSALLLSAFALLAVPAARAQLTFTVNEFTADKLVITLNPGTLLTTDGVDQFHDKRLHLVDAAGPNITWVNSVVFGSGIGAFGSATLDFSRTYNDSSSGDFVAFFGDRNLSTAGDLVTGLTFTFEGSGLFTPANVSTFALYWGDPIVPPATLQSTGSAITGATSSAPIPEPSAFAALAGLAGLGLAATRRRQRA